MLEKGVKDKSQSHSERIPMAAPTRLTSSSPDKDGTGTQ